MANLTPEQVQKYCDKPLTKNKDGTYSTKGNVNLSRLNLTRIPLKFKQVRGYFCCDNNKLTNLKGAPKQVGGSFYCYNNKLTTLKGTPQQIGGNFYCYNNQLKIPNIMSPQQYQQHIYQHTDQKGQYHTKTLPPNQQNTKLKNAYLIKQI